MRRISALLRPGLALVAFVLAATVLPAQVPMARYTLVPVSNGQQLRTPDGRAVFDYLTSKPTNVALTSPSVACFHPVLTPSGERVTALAPDDHPHHRGVYLAWHDSEFRQPIARPTNPTRPVAGWNITTADFWGWGEYAPREGRVIENTSVALTSADASKATIEIHNDWRVRQRKMADEVAAVTVSEQKGAFVLDYRFTITPVTEYLLHKASFGGFNFQARKDGTSVFTTSTGPVTLPDPHYSVPESNWPAAPWYGYAITLANGRTVGAAVVDHPSNPPSTWHNSRTLWMLNPVIAALGPYTIRPEAPLTLRYRVVVHDGPTPTALMDALAAEWRATN